MLLRWRRPSTGKINYRRDAPSRERLIALGQQALQELKDHPHAVSEASLVFEDGFREFAPQNAQYRADSLQESRRFFQEPVQLQRMVTWLEDKPFDDAAQRAETRVGKMLSRAWKADVISWRDEAQMSILKNLPSHVRYHLRRAQGYLLPKFFRQEVREQAFRLTPYASPAVVRLANRVADVIYKEGATLRQKPAGS